MKDYGKLTYDNEIPEYLKIYNSQNNEQCKQALDKGMNIMANCLSYCSGYNYWFYDQPFFRDIHKLNKIFKNLDDKIFKGEVNFKISEPKIMK